MKKLLVIITIVFFSLQFSFAQKLIVATYNRRNHNSSDSINGNGWYQRCPVICGLIRFNDFQIFGAQEVLHDQLRDMLKLLPEYNYVGVGRDDGKKRENMHRYFMRIKD